MLATTQAIIDGQPTAYATEGSGTPLLLLHGLGFDYRMWAPAAGYLAGHFRLLIPDLPGFAGSRKASWDGTPAALVRMVAGFLTTTHAVPAFVAGAGLGGTLALLLAARYPERVRGVIAIGAPSAQVWPKTTQAGLAHFAKNLGLLGPLLQIAPERHARQVLRDMLASGEPTPAMIQVMSEILRDPASRQTLIRALSRLDTWRETLPQLKGMRVPTLLIWGERDALYGLPEAERLRHSIPNAQLLSLPGAGHALTLERPAELAAAMRQAFAVGRA